MARNRAGERSEGEIDMNEHLIEKGLNEILHAGALGLPVAWPNMDPPTDVPRLEISVVGGDAQGGALKGAGQIETIPVTYQVLVVYPKGANTGTTNANATAASIKALYAEGHRFSLTGGGEVTLGLAQIRKGFSSGELWKVPVVVQATARN